MGTGDHFGLGGHLGLGGNLGTGGHPDRMPDVLNPLVTAAASGPAYDVLVALHVVTVVVGTGGLAVTSGYLVAGAARARRHQPLTPALARFFGPRPGWAPRLLYPAAALGLAAAGLSHDQVRLRAAWVWSAAVLWFGAAACIEAGMRPAEREVGRLVAEGTGATESGPALRRGVYSAAAALALALAASAVMVVKP